MAFLAFPVGANLDTGNINLLLTLMLWAAQFSGPRARRRAVGARDVDEVGAGDRLADPAAARHGAGDWSVLAVSIVFSLVLLPLTIVQFQALFGFGARPIRLDYLVFLWAFVPWLYRRSGAPACRASDGGRRSRRPGGGQRWALGDHARSGSAPAPDARRRRRAGRLPSRPRAEVIRSVSHRASTPAPDRAGERHDAAIDRDPDDVVATFERPM